VLTRLGNEGKGPGEVDGEADQRRSGDGGRGRGSAAVLRAPGFRGSTPGEPARPADGLTGPEWHRRQENGAAEGSPAAQGSSAPTPEARRRGLGFWGGGGVEMRTREAAGAFIRRRPP